MNGNALEQFLSFFRPKPAAKSRRRHSRRYRDKCVVLINDKLHPVLDWSIGGIQIAADERLFKEGDKLDIRLKFGISHDHFIDIDHKATVIRKGNGRLGLKFFPLTSDIRNSLHRIINDYTKHGPHGAQGAHG